MAIKNVTTQYVEKLYDLWLARPVLKNKIQSYSEKLGIAKPEKIVIKSVSNEKFLGYNENSSSMISRYLTNVAVVNKSTALKYYERLRKFSAFTAQHYDG